MKKKEVEIVGNPYKEAIYGVYHNGLLEMMNMLCCSNHPQEKVKIAMNMIVNMRSEARLMREEVRKRIKNGTHPNILTSKSKK